MEIKNQHIEVEKHPLEPFLPANAKLLMLGSFPPPRARWSMEFYYPNLQNDMWRIYGVLFFGDKDYFLEKGKKAFSRERLVAFLEETGVALFDTAMEVIRQRGNASDQFLEIVTPVDLDAVLKRIPECKAIVTTGQKATDTLLALVGAEAPKVGGFSDFEYIGRALRLYRMPNDLNDMIRVAEQVSDYILIPNVNSDVTLGRYLEVLVDVVHRYTDIDHNCSP